jgi:hypothetical protein
MTIKTITGPSVALAVAFAASSFAGCSGAQGGGMLPVASATQSQAQHHAAHPKFAATSSYKMIAALDATVDGTKMLVTSPASARRRSCSGIASQTGVPVTLSAEASFAVSPIAVGNFDCNGTHAAGTRTDYYIVVVTNPSSSSTDDSAVPIAGPAVQNGESLSFPVSVDPLVIEANTPSYFFIAAYTAQL